MNPAAGHGTSTAATIAVTVHLAAVVLLLVAGLASQDPLLDPWRPVAVTGVYGAPALLAAAGARGRRPLLLAAALATLGLALVPFSLHSFALGPAGVVYALVGARRTAPASRRGAWATVAVCPLLLALAFGALLASEDPRCATRSADDGGVQSGCTSDTVTWWEAGASLGLSASAVLTGLRLTRPRSRVGSP